MDKVQVRKVLALQATETGRTSIYDAFQDLKDIQADILTFNDYAVYRGLAERDFFTGSQTQLDHLFQYLLEKFAREFIELTIVLYSPVNLTEELEFNGIINTICLNLDDTCGIAISMTKATGGTFIFSENLGRLRKNVEFLLSS